MPVKDVVSAKVDLDRNIRQVANELPIAHLSLRNLDDMIGGVIPGRVIVLSGEPGAGKTTLLNQIGDDLAQQGHKVLYFSYEIAPRQLVAKSISRLSEGRLPVADIAGSLENPERAQQLRSAASQYESYADNIYHICDPSCDVLDISVMASKIERSTGKPPIVLLDYVQLVPSTDEKTINDERLQIKAVVSGLRHIANSHGAPVFAISSVGREHYDKPVTTLKCLGGCSYLEYSADSVLFLSVEGKGEERSTNMAQTQRPIVVTALKNRYGAMGSAPLLFNAANATFTERTGAA